jgi:hypothetical protein
VADYVTLSNLRTLVRQRADMEGSQFVTDEEIRQYCNLGYAELYDMLITNATSEDYFLNSSTVSLVSGTQLYSLPSDFYKLRGVDLNEGSDTFPLKRYNFPQRNVGSRYAVPYRFRYHLQGDKLRLTPKPSTNDSLTLWYIPSPKKMLEKTPTAITRGSTTMWTVGSPHSFVVGDLITGINFLATDYNVDQEITAIGAATVTTDLDSSGLADPTVYGSIESRFNFYSGWDSFVILAASANCIIKEEGDPAPIFAMKEQQRNRILSVSDNRDLGEPATVTDVSVYYTDPGNFSWYQ